MAEILVPDGTTTVQKASIGCTVHYFPKVNGLGAFLKPGPYAATVTAVSTDGLTVNIHAFHNSNLGMHFIENVPHQSIAGDGLAWDWPVKVN